jgi:hypothetical protein
MLKTKEVKEFIKRELEPYFLEQGFTSKNEKEFVFSYNRDNDGISNKLDGYLLKYNEYVFVYNFYFGLQKVIDILKQINKHVPINGSNYTIQNKLICISPGSILFPRETSRPYKDFDNEFRLKLILFDIQAFYQSYYRRFCNKYGDIKQLNKLYNRLDDFRIDSWEFPNLAFFHVTRLIIADSPTTHALMKSLRGIFKHWNNYGNRKVHYMTDWMKVNQKSLLQSI